MSFKKWVYPCNHPPSGYRVLLPLQKVPLGPSQSIPILLHQSNSPELKTTTDLIILPVLALHKWNKKESTVLCLTYFAQHLAFKNHASSFVNPPLWSVYSNLFPLKNNWLVFLIHKSSLHFLNTSLLSHIYIMNIWEIFNKL